MSKIGEHVFIQDLIKFQEDVADKPHIERQHTLVKPVSKTMRKVSKFLESWILIACVAFTIITVKIFVEFCLERIK